MFSSRPSRPSLANQGTKSYKLYFASLAYAFLFISVISVPPWTSIETTHDPIWIKTCLNVNQILLRNATNACFCCWNRRRISWEIILEGYYSQRSTLEASDLCLIHRLKLLGLWRLSLWSLMIKLDLPRFPLHLRCLRSSSHSSCQYLSYGFCCTWGIFEALRNPISIWFSKIWFFSPKIYYPWKM